MRIAHIGPRLARRGGPAGYLRQLALAAAEESRPCAHEVAFPRVAEDAPPGPRTPSPGLARVFKRVRRTLTGAPKFYRPSHADLLTRHGGIEAMIREANRGVIALARETLDEARRTSPDVVFAHEPAVAESLLAARRERQQVWLMIHAPMPLALYLTWSWGVPTLDWRDVMALPDVQAWTGWELDIWSRVDRVVIPCAEAVEELERADRRAAAAIEGRVSFVVTGATGGQLTTSRADARLEFGLPAGTPVGLYLGNREPYRGLDALIEGVRAVDEGAAGLVAVAGPDRRDVPSHPRIRALGPVKDVRALLEAVDFIINVNRFSLFDLSTIEAAEAGKPMLLHAAGGNRAFRDLGCGVELFHSLAPDAIAAALAAMFAMSPERRADLGARSRACYERQLTPSHLWRRHVELYDMAAAELSREGVLS